MKSEALLNYLKDVLGIQQFFLDPSKLTTTNEVLANSLNESPENLPLANKLQSLRLLFWVEDFSLMNEEEKELMIKMIEALKIASCHYEVCDLSQQSEMVTYKEHLKKVLQIEFVRDLDQKTLFQLNKSYSSRAILQQKNPQDVQRMKAHAWALLQKVHARYLQLYKD